MAGYALVRVSDGAIIERREFDIAPQQPNPVKGLRWLTDAPPVVPFWQIATAVTPVANPDVATAITYTVANRALAVVKALKRQAINARRDQAAALPISVTVNAVAFQLDSRDVFKVTDVATAALIAKQRAFVKTFVITDSNDVDRVLTIEQALDLTEQVQDRLSAINANARTHKQAVTALTTAQAVADYDFTGGW